MIYGGGDKRSDYVREIFARLEVVYEGSSSSNMSKVSGISPPVRWVGGRQSDYFLADGHQKKNMLNWLISSSEHFSVVSFYM